MLISIDFGLEIPPIGKVKFVGRLGIDLGRFLTYCIDNGNVLLKMKISNIPII
jgi:hypothetical protein